MMSKKLLTVLALSTFLVASGNLNYQGIEIEVNDPYGEAETAEFDRTRSQDWLAAGRRGERSDYGSVTLVGRVPRMYFGSDSVGSDLAKVVIKDGIITELSQLGRDEFHSILRDTPKGTILLAESKSTPTSDYDVIYPGLIDLHNHPKQNNLPTWDLARGQFKNRFEWSGWSGYKNVLASNMNPWVNATSEATCSAFRWSELQAMILGTTYMQGYVSTSCVKNFAIHRVEDGDAFRYGDSEDEELAVSAPSFVINPDEAKSIWNDIRLKLLSMARIKEAPDASIEEKIANVYRLNEKGFGADEYNQAVFSVVEEVCPGMTAAEGITDAVSAENTRLLEDKDMLEKYCEVSDRSESLARYLNRLHKSITGRQELLSDPRMSGIVAHAAEGRHDDVYNRLEFPMFMMMGIARPGMNLVHALGLDEKGFEYMADNQMGIIWSPYSNLLLYGESLDFTTLRLVNNRRGKKDLMIALGSDWVPTGSKSVLEEVKLAKEYLERQERLTGVKVTEAFDDRELFKMMTENPARMIGHYHDGRSSEHGIGTIAEGALGTLIVTKNVYSRNAFTNIVEHVGEGEINLVVVDGKVIYGERRYLDSLGYEGQYEVLPEHFSQLANLRPDKSQRGTGFVAFANSVESDDEVVRRVGTEVASMELTDNVSEERCDFAERKGFVFSEVTHGNEFTADGVEEFLQATGGRRGLNLNRVAGLQKLLGALLMTQSSNAVEGKYEHMLDYFPSLYSCSDANTEPHLERISTFIAGADGDPQSEMDENLRMQEERYLECGSCQSSGAGKMQEAYGF